MDRAHFRCVLVLIGLLALRASAACTSYGVDYSNGGAYYIDGSSNQYFTFVSVFQGTLSMSRALSETVLIAIQDAPRGRSTPF
jgi:hypothetical protein